MFRISQMTMTRYALLVAATMLAFPIVGSSAQTPWFAGVVGGVSSLRPETQNSPFSIDSSVSFGGGIFAGYDFNKLLSFEAGYNYLGNATLSGVNGKKDIGYSAYSIGALMYLYGEDANIAQRDGFVGYLRLGVNSMSNSTSIPLEREDNVAVLAGVGVEWPLNHNLNLRGEITSFDGDAQTARVSVLYRPRANTQITPNARAPESPEPVVLAPTPTPTPTQQESESVSAVEQSGFQEVPQSKNSAVDTTDKTKTATAINTCFAPMVDEPVDRQGCALFGGILSGVQFASGSATLTQASLEILDVLSDNLLRYSSMVIEIQAHTETLSSSTLAKEIAKQRAIAVARHLAGRGVPVKRLRARSFGDTRPLNSDDTDAGREQNNRIELRVLP